MNVASDHECGSDTVSIDALGRRYTVKPGPKPSGYAGKPFMILLSPQERKLADSLASEEETSIADILREGLLLYAQQRHSA